MNICKICKLPIMDGGYLHEYSFGGSLKLEETHTGICAEIFNEQLEQVLSDPTDDEVSLTESLEEKFDGYQIL